MESLTPVRPAVPAAGYQGGKKNLARRICALIDRVPHDGYAEPFVGMGGIFLRRGSRPKVEVINDLAGDVVTLFRVLQEHYPYFIDMLRFRLASRGEFERLRGQDPARLTDLQRAARFLYLQRLAFGGRVSGRSFGVSPREGSAFNISRIEPLLGEIHARLSGVTIEQLPYATFLRRYDREGMLFYLDPPYAGSEGVYGYDLFGPEDFARLASALGELRGRFVMSINDRPDVRACFAQYRLTPIETTWGLAVRGAGTGRVGELLVSNFQLPDAA